MNTPPVILTYQKNIKNVLNKIKKRKPTHIKVVYTVDDDNFNFQFEYDSVLNEENGDTFSNEARKWFKSLIKNGSSINSKSDSKNNNISISKFNRNLKNNQKIQLSTYMDYEFLIINEEKLIIDKIIKLTSMEIRRLYYEYKKYISKDIQTLYFHHGFERSSFCDHFIVIDNIATDNPLMNRCNILKANLDRKKLEISNNYNNKIRNLHYQLKVTKVFHIQSSYNTENDQIEFKFQFGKLLTNDTNDSCEGIAKEFYYSNGGERLTPIVIPPHSNMRIRNILYQIFDESGTLLTTNSEMYFEYVDD